MTHPTRIESALVTLLALVGCIAAQPAPAQTLAAQEGLSESYRGSQRDNVAYQKVEPFKVFDSLYYVGPGFVSAWLIVTNAGLVLVDAAQEPYVDHVIEGIGKLGFDPGQIKYILITHGHLDHFGGATRIQALSGARVGMLDPDWQAMAQAALPTATRAALAVPKRDLVLKEGDTLTLGNTVLEFSQHPGHTPGSLSITFTVYDSGQAHKAFIFGGPGPRNGVSGAEQFMASSKRVALIRGIEVSVPVHSWLNDYPYPNGSVFERARKLASRKPGEPHPFVDAASWQLWMKQVQEGAQRNLIAEQKKAAEAATRK